MTVSELLDELRSSERTNQITYSDEVVIGTSEENDKLVINTSPESEDPWNVEVLLDALTSVDGTKEVYVNDLLLDDVDVFNDLFSFDLYTEEE